MSAIRGTRLLASALAVLATVAGAIAPASRAASAPSPQRAIEMLNEWRAHLGEQPVVEDPAQTEGCRLHAEYRHLNPDTSGHYEDPSRPGYTPEGHKAAASSVLVTGGGAFYDPANGYNGPFVWEPYVYHRAGLLNPRLATTGFWSDPNTSCMGDSDTAVRTEPQLTAHPYPYDGQRDVGTIYNCLETPDPCQVVPGADREHPPGFILSLQLNGPWEWLGSPVVANATLTPDGGDPAEILVLGQDVPSQSSIPLGTALIPRRPLTVATWYTVHVQGSLAVPNSAPGPEEVNVPFDVSWRFQTLLDSGGLGWGVIRPQRLCRYLIRCPPAYERPRVHVDSGSPAPITVRVLEGPSRHEVARGTVAPGHDLAFDLSPGRYRFCVEQPATDHFASVSDCFSETVLGYPRVALPATARRTRDGRRLRIVVQPDPILVGREASVFATVVKSACTRGRCTRSWNSANEQTVTLRSRTVLFVPAPPRAFAGYLAVTARRFAIGPAHYKPLMSARLYLHPNRVALPHSRHRGRQTYP